MPAMTLGFAEFENRLRLIRRRLNLFVLQHVLYFGGALGLLAAALLVALALRAPASQFRAGLWVTIVITAASTVLAGLGLRKRWHSLERVARLADRKVGMEDRLSTLLAQRAAPHRSRLRPVLLAEVFALGSRWEARAVAPRRVPRSIYLAIVALAALAATTLIPPAGDRGRASQAKRHVQAADQDAEAVTGARQLQIGRAQRLGTSGIGEAERWPGSGEATDAAASARSGSGAGRRWGDSGGPLSPGARGELSTGDLPRAGTAGPGGVGEPVPGDQSVVERVQNMIRRAVGADPLTAGAPGRMARPAERSGQRQAREEASAGDERRAGAQHGRPSGNGSPRRPAEGPVGKKGSSAAGREPGGPKAAPGGSGGEAGGLFAHDKTEASSPRAKAFMLKLTDFSARAPTMLKPQGRRRGDAGRIVAGAERASAAARQPSERQTGDASLQKAEIAPEHEAIFRHIFSRQAPGSAAASPVTSE